MIDVCDCVNFNPVCVSDDMKVNEILDGFLDSSQSILYIHPKFGLMGKSRCSIKNEKED
jgi:hypothetical protein